MLKSNDDIICYLFAGQGFNTEQIQKIDKQKDIFPYVEDIYSDVFNSYFPDLSELSTHDLKQNQITTFILVLSSLFWIKKTIENNLRPKFVAGYSVGQYAALCYSGVLSMEDYASIMIKRSKIINEVVESQSPGLMGNILGLSETKLRNIILENNMKNSVDISNYNAPGNYTIAGEYDDIKKLISVSLKSGAMKSELMTTTGAWHSYKMKPAAKKISVLLENYTFGDMEYPVIEHVYGKNLVNKRSVIIDNLSRQVYYPVKWVDTVKKLIEMGANTFLELSDFDMLTKMGLFISRKQKFLNISNYL